MELESDNLTCLALKPNQLRFSGSGSVSFPHSINTQKTTIISYICFLIGYSFKNGRRKLTLKNDSFFSKIIPLAFMHCAMNDLL